MAHPPRVEDSNLLLDARRLENKNLCQASSSMCLSFAKFVLSAVVPFNIIVFFVVWFFVFVQDKSKALQKILISNSKTKNEEKWFTVEMVIIAAQVLPFSSFTQHLKSLHEEKYWNENRKEKTTSRASNDNGISSELVVKVPQVQIMACGPFY